MIKTTLLWTLAAIAGVVLVAGVTYAASGLSTQTIGLSSEPLTAGEQLSPRETASPAPTATPQRKAGKPKRKRKPRATATPTPLPPVATVAPTADDHDSGIEPGDDSGGHGRNSGKGGGGGGGGDD